MRPSKPMFKKQLPQKPPFTELSDHTSFCMDLLGDATALVLPKSFLPTQNFRQASGTSKARISEHYIIGNFFALPVLYRIIFAILALRLSGLTIKQSISLRGYF